MIAADITPGSWVRFDRRDDRWRRVDAVRPGDGTVTYDAHLWPGGRPFYGFAGADEPCRIVTVSPRAVVA